MNQADLSSSCRAIENLIAAYAELVDDGDFAEVAEMLADATFTGGAGSMSGRGAIEKMLRESLIVYDDGTPRTKHVTTNVVIEVDEEAGTAVSHSYFTALQALPDLAPQPIVSGRYYDRFVRRDGQWRFVERRVRTDLIGDVSHHLRSTSPTVVLPGTGSSGSRCSQGCPPSLRFPRTCSQQRTSPRGGRRLALLRAGSATFTAPSESQSASPSMRSLRGWSSSNPAALSRLVGLDQTDGVAQAGGAAPVWVTPTSSGGRFAARPAGQLMNCLRPSLVASG